MSSNRSLQNPGVDGSSRVMDDTQSVRPPRRSRGLPRLSPGHRGAGNTSRTIRLHACCSPGTWAGTPAHGTPWARGRRCRQAVGHLEDSHRSASVPPSPVSSQMSSARRCSRRRLKDPPGAPGRTRLGGGTGPAHPPELHGATRQRVIQGPGSEEQPVPVPAHPGGPPARSRRSSPRLGHDDLSVDVAEVQLPRSVQHGLSRPVRPSSRAGSARGRSDHLLDALTVPHPAPDPTVAP